MIKCIIVEDEIAGQVLLKKKLNEFYPKVKVEGVFDNKNDTLNFLKENKDIDLIFLDIEIVGENSINILESIDTSKIETCIITAYQQYAVEALNNNASFYILKPIHDTLFRQGMDQILSRISERREDATILVTQNRITIRLKVKEILYIESEGAYSNIYTINQRFVTSKNLAYYEATLPTSKFYRVHNSFLINLNHIEGIEKEGRTGVINLTNDTEIPISQRKMSKFFELLKEA